MSLPIMQTDDQDLSLMQTRWASQLNPLLSAPLANAALLRNVAISTGSNTINHKLGRKLQGWCITRIRSAAQIYDEQDGNARANLTLTLVSDADCIIDLLVF